MGKELKLIEAASIACRSLEDERILWRFALLWQGVRGAYAAFSTLLRDLAPFLCLVTSAPLPPQPEHPVCLVDAAYPVYI